MVYFAFVIHDHQPVGNLDEAMEETYRLAYLPFLDVLEKHPRIRIAMHHSGCLIEWLESQHADYLDRLAALAAAGQVEPLTGAFYEPILPAIPHRDAVDQIRALTDWTQARLRMKPQGMWLAERVWEPYLAAPLAEAGVGYALLDDVLFRAAGVEEKDSLGYFATEHEGRRLFVFPINERVRQAVPFQTPDKVIALLRELGETQPDGLVLFADDGEKLGGWPETYRTVYEEGWLETFFGLLEQAEDEITMALPREYVSLGEAKRLIYLPPGSYREMQEWSGGLWRHFLSKYPEANRLHKKMLVVSEKAAQAPAEVRQDLWRGQCNDAYWHGVFGGLYLPHLRGAAYRNLIRAEIAAEQQARVALPREQVRDYDADGSDEVLVESDLLAAYLSPRLGGAIVELDDRLAGWNLAAALHRQPEPYHERLGAPPPYDWYQRLCLLDHFLAPGTPLDAFAQCAYGEQGDFVNQAYLASVDRSGGHIAVTLQREGRVWVAEQQVPVALAKTVAVRQGEAGLGVGYEMRNDAEQAIEARFGVEFNFTLSGCEMPARRARLGQGEPIPLDQPAEAEAASLRLTDEWLGMAVEIALAEPTAIWLFPLSTISLAVEGPESLYQGTGVLLSWPISLAPGARWRASFAVRLVDLARGEEPPGPEG